MSNTFNNEDDIKKTEEKLKRIFCTRLLFNTKREFGDFFGWEKSLNSNNSLWRCLGKDRECREKYKQNLDEAYDRLKWKVMKLSNDQINLDEFLSVYKSASNCYAKKLKGKKPPIGYDSWASLLLRNIYNSHKNLDSVDKRVSDIFKDIFETDLARCLYFSVLILLSLDALRSYRSRENDIIDMERTFDEVFSYVRLKLPEKYRIYIKFAEDVPEKTQLTLCYRTAKLLYFCDLIGDPESRLQLLRDKQNYYAPINVVGYWTDNDAALQYGAPFWEFRKRVWDNLYTLFKWTKKEDKLIEKKYIAHFYNLGDKLGFLLQNDEYAGDSGELKNEEYVNYITTMPSSLDSPGPLQFEVYSDVYATWQREVLPSKLVPANQEGLAKIKRWMEAKQTTANVDEHQEERWETALHAITSDHLYIASGEEHIFYEMPRKQDDIEHIRMSDIVWIIEEDGQRWIYFGGLDKYIRVTPEELAKYGIKKVKISIEEVHDED